MKKNSIFNILKSSTDYLITLQSNDGSFPSGHNGPYFDIETPVRNTAHLLFLISVQFEKTKEEYLKRAAEKAVYYLLSKPARPNLKTFYCRNNPHKDKCNGLIGQAWVMEALIKASEVFDRADCYQLAEEIFLLHPWIDTLGLWKRVDIHGEILSYDGTFNHQLWFAAIAAKLSKTDIAKERSLFFLRKVASKFKLYKDGIIFHESPMFSILDSKALGFNQFYKELKNKLRMKKDLFNLYSKSVGYHAFNLYAFAMLKESFPNEDLWKSSVFNKTLNVLDTDIFKKYLLQSEFGYFYNISGIEIAFALETFFNDSMKCSEWLNIQFKYTYENIDQPLIKNAHDKNTALARIYELARLKYNYEIKI